VLKAGGIVLVLDPMSPDEVNQTVLDDAQPAALLHDGARAEQAAGFGAGGAPVLALADLIESGSPNRPLLGTGPGSPAMLAYSSGTTAGAKAAVIPHRALLHLTR